MHKSLFDRADIELFLAVADSGSLAKAAAALAIHHATAFRRLADVEVKAGALLFDRLAGGYALTRAGKLLIEPARQLVGELNEFDARVLNFDKALAGSVRATTSDGIAATYLPRHLALFRQRYPDIEVELVVENRMMDLSAREVDVAIRPAKRLAGTMVGRNVGKMGYSLYASPDYVKRHGTLDPKSPDLSGHALIGYHESIAYYSTAKWLARHERRAKVAARCNNLIAMQGLAQAGAGIAALPCAVGDDDAQLVRLLPPIEAMSTNLWLCTHPSIRKVARVRALLDSLYATMSDDKGRLAGTR